MSTVDSPSSRMASWRDPVRARLTRRGWSLGSAVLRAVECLLTWQERSRQRHQLQCLSDHMLRDIGLTRADILAESTRPFWRP